MDRQFTTEDIGEQLGMEGVGSVVSKVEAYCAYEERRIELINQPRIVSLQAEGKFLLDEERDLVERLKLAPPPGDLRSRRRKAIYYGCVAAFLTLAAFVFSTYSFEPFRVGLKGYLYCLGVAIVTPFLVDKVIEWWRAEMLIRSVATFACVAALASLVLLAVIRGDLLAESMKDSDPVIVFDDAQPQTQPPQTENTFYDRTTTRLQLVMILLAVAMELAAGLALHEVRRMTSDTTEDWEALRSRLAEIRWRMSLLASQIAELQNEPAVFLARFWTSFYKTMITHTLRSAMTKLLVAVVAILLAVHGHAIAQSASILVIAVDLSQSVAVRNPDGKTEFQKNIDAVTKQLAQAPSDSRVTVIGITDHSFTQPDILLSATIPTDPGYFGERLKAARSQLVQVWRTRSAKLEPRYRATDIIGAFLLAAQMFEQQPQAVHKTLVIYSDMRQSTRELDLERARAVPSFSEIAIKRKVPIAKLQEVQVFVLGVDGAGKPPAFWQSLRDLWAEYFRATGAVLRSYSAIQ